MSLSESDAAVTAWMKSKGWNVTSGRREEDPDLVFYIWQDDPSVGRSHALWIDEAMLENLSPEQLVEVLEQEGVAQEVRINFRVRIQERGAEYRISVVPRRSGEQRRLP